MLYQLPDGRTIELSISDYLDFSDEEIRGLLAYDEGRMVNDPFFASASRKPGRPEPEEDITHDIDKVSSLDKLKDQDYTPDED
tara:strand:+ start:4129 stop:4377 length:249 start_codon:yes stop_codon:yes gene_type:complete